MSLQDFAKSTEASKGAELLSQRLLYPTIQIRRRYELVDTKRREPIESISDVVLMPYSAYLGVYGAGLITVGGKEYPAVFCNERLAPLNQPTPLQELKKPNGLQQVIQEICKDDAPSETVALGLKTPTPYFGPSGVVDCGGKRGTLGALVTTVTGEVGILTAGHVGAPLGASALSSGSVFGDVTYTEDPANRPPATLSADVAVVTIRPSRMGSFISLVQINGAVKAGVLDRLESHCARGRCAAGILGKAPWIFVPQMAGLWADIYMTHAPISSPGDSGAPVLLESSDKIVGHVVGGSAGMTTYVQDIDYQLASCNCQLRIKP